MQRASDLYGLPVMDSATNRKIGAVSDVLVDLPQKRLVALVLPGLLLEEPGLIPVSPGGFGEELRIDREMIAQGEEASKLRQGNLTLDRIRKLTVFTRSGDRLGNVEDLILDGCQIAALELSDGLIQDIFQGRTTLELPEEAEFQGEQIIVPDNIEAQPYQQKLDGSWHRDQGF